VLVNKSALVKLPFRHPLVTYGDGRVVTLKQFALEQSLEQSELIQIKNAPDNSDAFFISKVAIQL